MHHTKNLITDCKAMMPACERFAQTQCAASATDMQKFLCKEQHDKYNTALTTMLSRCRKQHTSMIFILPTLCCIAVMVQLSQCLGWVEPCLSLVLSPQESHQVATFAEW